MGVSICTSHWLYWRDWLCGSGCRIRYVATLLFQILTSVFNFHVLTTDSIPSPSAVTRPFVHHRAVCCSEVVHRLAKNYQLLVSSAIAGMAHKKNCGVQNFMISRGELSGPHSVSSKKCKWKFPDRNFLRYEFRSLGYDAVSFSEWVLTFKTIVVPSSSKFQACPWRRRRCDSSKHQEPLIHWHSVTSQNTWIFSNTAVRTSKTFLC